MFQWKQDLIQMVYTYLFARERGLTTSEWDLTFTGITIGQFGFGVIHRPVRKDEDSNG